MEGDRQRTLVAGCDGYIQKPIDVDAFPSQVGEFLRGKRERVEEREEGLYLRELNQRLVYRLLSQVEELKRRQRALRAPVRASSRTCTAPCRTSPPSWASTALLEKLLPGAGPRAGQPPA